MALSRILVIYFIIGAIFGIVYSMRAIILVGTIKKCKAIEVLGVIAVSIVAWIFILLFYISGIGSWHRAIMKDIKKDEKRRACMFK